MKPLLENNLVSNQDFRDNHLWTPDVRLLYSMNELLIRKIYTLYCANENAKNSVKPLNSNYMDLPDCIQLLTKDK